MKLIAGSKLKNKIRITPFWKSLFRIYQAMNINAIQKFELRLRLKTSRRYEILSKNKR